MRVHRDVERSVALELERHAQLGRGSLDGIEVLEPETVERVELVGPPGEAVLAPMGEARLAESAVPPRGRPPDRLRLDEHDVRAGVALLREHGCPQTGVAAADDGEIGDVVVGEHAPRRSATVRGDVVEPEHRLAGVGERVLHDGCRRPASFEDGCCHEITPLRSVLPSSRAARTRRQRAVSRHPLAVGQSARMSQ